MPLIRISSRKLRALLESESHHTRRYGVRVAAVQKDRESLNMLRSAVFDSHSGVRLWASSVLARRIGLRATVDFIRKRYPGSSLSKVPKEFFLSAGTFPIVQSQRRKGNPTLKEDPLARKKYGKPVFFHRGFPVYVAEREIGGATNRSGVITIDKDGKIMPRKFWKAFAEHEYGETWSHQIGLALEMIWLKKNGLLEEYIKQKPRLAFDFFQVLNADPKGFKEFAKPLKYLTDTYGTKKNSKLYSLKTGYGAYV